MATYTTTQEVESYLKLGPDRDAAELKTVVDACNALVTQWNNGRETPALKLGTTMLAARVYRRRNSPAGVEALGEMGPVYVSRRDPDLSMLLGLDQWAIPKVG